MVRKQKASAEAWSILSPGPLKIPQSPSLSLSMLIVAICRAEGAQGPAETPHANPLIYGAVRPLAIHQGLIQAPAGSAAWTRTG